jgi:hypothetical protein
MGMSNIGHVGAIQSAFDCSRVGRRRQPRFFYWWNGENWMFILPIPNNWYQLAVYWQDIPIHNARYCWSVFYIASTNHLGGRTTPRHAGTKP